MLFRNPSARVQGAQHGRVLLQLRTASCMCVLTRCAMRMPPAPHLMQEVMLPALNGLLAGEEWQRWEEDLDRLW